MKEAYIKAIKVIESCKTSTHIMAAYNYIWNFRKLFANEKDIKVLTEKLHTRCYSKRKRIGDKHD